MIKFGVVSLGCDKNRVDSEIIIYNLKNYGYTLTADAADADVIIINTCAFILPAREESIDTIFEYCQLKQNKNIKIIVTGCLSQKYTQQIFDDFVEVDAFVGINDYGNIGSVVDKVLKGERVKLVTDNPLTINGEQRTVSTPTHYAYLKIADGCDNHCTYCAIPSIRGKYRSKPLQDIIDEAVGLVKNGAKELILIAQDTTMYGIDLYNRHSLVELLQGLSKIDNLEYIRLLYCYPEQIDDNLIEEIKNNKKIIKYLDIPLQHISSTVLKKMGRYSTEQSIYALFDKLYKNIPNLTLRTTFMLGFPYETEQDVDILCKFIEDVKIYNVGFFTFSAEEGTAAYKLPNQLDQHIKLERLNRVSSAQQKQVELYNAQLVGQIVECFVESCVATKKSKYIYCGRTLFQSPHIDGNIYFNSKIPLDIGNVVKVKITAFEKYDLIGDTYELTK